MKTVNNILSWIKIWIWCDLLHWGEEKKIVSFYSNQTHKYYCKKCKHKYDE